MQLPIIEAAPVVRKYSWAFRDLFVDERQFKHFENYLTGLMVLDNKSLANMSRCILNSADKTNLSRFLSEAPWNPQDVQERRIQFMLSQTSNLRQGASSSYLIIDDTLCEHVGSLFEHIDRHYNHSNDSYPLAHNIVTSYYLSGAVRFPLDFEVYRRYEDVTKWPAFVEKHFPGQLIAKQSKERAKLHRQIDKVLLEDEEFAILHRQFQSKIIIAQALLEQAVARNLPFETVLMDSWYLSPELVEKLKELHKDWVSLLKRNRNLEVSSFQLRDAQGKAVSLSGPSIKVENLVPLIPHQSYRKISLNGQEYWCFTITVRIAGLGKVRLVISFENSELTGTYAVLITNRTDWSAKEILSQYLLRWPIETFYRDGKQLLGLGDYRMRSLEAIEAHWTLVFAACSLLHLDCLPSSSSKGLAAPLQSIGAACRQQGQALVQSLILMAHEFLQQGQSVTEVFSKLFSKQQEVIAV